MKCVGVTIRKPTKTMSYDEFNDYELKDLLENLVNQRIKARQRQLQLTQEIAGVKDMLKKRGYTF